MSLAVHVDWLFIPLYNIIVNGSMYIYIHTKLQLFYMIIVYIIYMYLRICFLNEVFAAFEVLKASLHGRSPLLPVIHRMTLTPVPLNLCIVLL